jgi:hypothetical protein
VLTDADPKSKFSKSSKHAESRQLLAIETAQLEPLHQYKYAFSSKEEEEDKEEEDKDEEDKDEEEVDDDDIMLEELSLEDEDLFLLRPYFCS